MTTNFKAVTTAFDTLTPNQAFRVCFTSGTGLVDLETVQRLSSDLPLVVSVELTEEQFQAIEDKIDIEEGMEMMNEEGGISVDDLRKELGL